MDLKTDSPLTVPLPELRDLFLRCFEGYVVPIQFDLAQFVERLRTDGVDLAASIVLCDGFDPVGLMLVARRGATSRLAAMGVVRSRRAKGVGAWAMEQLFAAARARGDRKMVLEVIEQNPPAVRLYERLGFQTRERLVGFHGALDAGSADGLQEVDIPEFTRALAAHEGSDLPWQVTSPSFGSLGAPYRAWRRGSSWALTSNPTELPAVLRAIVTETNARRRGQAQDLLRALGARFPETLWRVPAVAPVSKAGLFEAVGLAREELSQLQMEVQLTEPAS